MKTPLSRLPSALLRWIGFATICVLAAPVAEAANQGADNFLNAPTINVPYTIETLTDTSGYTREAGEPIHSADNFGRSAWWKFIAPTTGSCTVETLPTDGLVDTAIAVYTGNSLASLTRIAQGENVEAQITSRVTFFATAGSVYRIAVESEAAASSTAEQVLLRLRQSADGPRTYIGDWRQPNDNTINSANGLLTMTMSASGAITGKLTVGQTRYSFKTQATADSRAIVAFPAKPGSGDLPLTLSVDLASASISDVLDSFSVTNGDTINGTGPLSPVMSPELIAPYVGKFSVGLGFSSATGSGYFLSKTSANGRITASGFSGDGQPISFGTQLTKSGRIYIHQGLSSGNGFFHGRAAAFPGFINIIGGRLWYRRASAPGTFYPNGFFSEVTGSGDRQVPTPSGSRVLGFLNASMGVGKLVVADAPGEISSLTEALTLSTTNRFAFANAARKPSLKISVSTGVVTGSITQPSGVVRKMRGILHDDFGSLRLRGFVTGTARTAAFSVTP